MLNAYNVAGRGEAGTLQWPIRRSGYFICFGEVGWAGRDSSRDALAGLFL